MQYTNGGLHRPRLRSFGSRLSRYAAWQKKTKTSARRVYFIMQSCGRRLRYSEREKQTRRKAASNLMTASVNKVFLLGRTTKDPELRYTPKGTAIVEIGLAVNRTWSEEGQKREETVFVDV